MDIETVVKANLFPRVPSMSLEFKEFLKDVKQSKVSDVKDTLADHNKFLVYEFDFLEKTALHHAAANGDFMMVTLLLQFKSDPNHKDVQGNNPLFYAVKNGNLNTIRWLLLNCHPTTDQICRRKRFINYSIPTYMMLKLTVDETIANMLTKGLEVCQSLLKLNFAKRHENWKSAMEKALNY